MGAAADRWASQLAGWGIPEEIIAAAPSSPWTFPVELFRRYASTALKRDVPSVHLALEALGEGGSVLDVGCGAGATSAPLAARYSASSVTGVDASAEMLVAFADRMADLRVAHREVEGQWPAVATSVEPADIVVCGHVLYNVGDITPFVRALDDRARRRVVLELTERHPRSWMSPLWRVLHGLERPEGPTPDDALAVVRDAGLPAQLERWEEDWSVPDEISFEFVRRMLCLRPERDDELRAALAANPRPDTRGLAAIWWDRA
jgi:SAM-dependent methyltransferase